MPGKSQSHTDAVLNVLRGTDLTGVAPYVGLFSVAPADDNSAGTELAGNGYARLLLWTTKATFCGHRRYVVVSRESSAGVMVPLIERHIKRLPVRAPARTPSGFCRRPIASSASAQGARSARGLSPSFPNQLRRKCWWSRETHDQARRGSC